MTRAQQTAAYELREWALTLEALRVHASSGNDDVRAASKEAWDLTLARFVVASRAYSAALRAERDEADSTAGR